MSTGFHGRNKYCGLTVHERFVSMTVRPENGCWFFLNHETAKRKYPLFWNGTKAVKAMKWSYEFYVGPVPSGKTLDHLCRNTKCINPHHFEVVTRGENTLRGNSPSGINLRKTVCTRGHDLTPENVRVSQGIRVCLKCESILNRIKKRNRKLKRLGLDGFMSIPRTPTQLEVFLAVESVGFPLVKRFDEFCQSGREVQQ